MKQQRPLSPHLQVYRLPKTAIASITHRFTGFILAMSLFVLACCISTIAAGPEAFARFQIAMDSFLGKFFIFNWILALMFHACHGTRHLLWDCGIGFNREKMDRLVIIEIIAACLLTLTVYLISAV